MKVLSKVLQFLSHHFSSWTPFMLEKDYEKGNVSIKLRESRGAFLWKMDEVLIAKQRKDQILTLKHQTILHSLNESLSLK